MISYAGIRLHAIFAEVLPCWIPGKQQDAHEFLLALLDRMNNTPSQYPSVAADIRAVEPLLVTELGLAPAESMQDWDGGIHAL